jgi:uncharacterized protein (TIGR02598 family)
MKPSPPFQQLGYRFGCRHKGFSLIEVVLALGIVGFSLIGILGLFPVALNTAKDSQNETRVAFIAQSIYSDFRTLRGIRDIQGNLHSLTNSTVLTNNYALEGTLTNAAQKFFTATITVKTAPALLPSGFQVDTTFYWPGAGQTNSFTALIAP